MPGRFTSPPDPATFRMLVWDLVRQIPAGKVSTYGKIAAFLPPPAGMEKRDYVVTAPRWVGGAMANCPSDVPWQRVINSQGKISLPKGKGFEQQLSLLMEEGIEFDDRERVDLTRFSWGGPDDEWYDRHGLDSRPPDAGSTQGKLNL
jgi:methylated-DNA-protein-cysteine methyltransferase related protein